MAEGTYEYECNRAELLGIDLPNRANWEETERVRKENELSEQMTEIDIQEEKINEDTSKMDEIANILSITQMRLKKFTKACGSLTNLLKVKGSGEGSESQVVVDTNQQVNVDSKRTAPVEQENMQKKMSSGLDKLDTLITKTENAHYSMAHQSKQMKSFLK